MTKFLRCFPLIILGVLTACGGGSVPSSNDSHASVVLQSIQVSAGTMPLIAGLTGQLTAMGSYSDGSTKDLTKSATWSSSNPAVATIAGNGLAKAMAPGSCVVTAAQASLTGTTTLTIVPPVLVSIAVTSASASVASGLTDQFTATGTYSDGSSQDLSSSATWSVSNPAVASIAPSGVATALSTGSAVITAAQGSIKGTAHLTVTPPSLVSIAVSAAGPSVAVGLTDQFTATGTYSDGSSQTLGSSVTWSTSNSAVASISGIGLATGTSHGSVVITATSGTVSGTANLSVTSLVSIAITLPLPAVESGTTEQLRATGTFSDGSTQDITGTVTWASSDTTKATISNSIPTNGMVQALKAGSSIITASSGGVSASSTLTVNSGTLTSIVVTPATPTIPLKVVQQFTATGSFSDGKTQDVTNTVAWSSSQNAVASTTVSGAVTALSVGTATITATSGAVSGNVLLTVNASNLASITIQQGNVTMAQGTSTKFNAIGLFTDGSTQDVSFQATWTSSNPGFGTIQSGGRARAVSPGLTTITATLASQSVSVNLNVTSATIVSISVTPSIFSIAPGSQRTFAATGVFSDSSSQIITADVTWASSDNTVATMSGSGAKGLATAVGTGAATISATFGSTSGTAQLNVTAATLTSLALTPATGILSPASILPYTATGTFSDGTSQDLSAIANWSTSSTSIATVTSFGAVTGQSAGTAVITASVGGVSSTANILVESSALTHIDVLPSNPFVPQQISTYLTALGTFADGKTQNLTSAVTWTSSSPAVAIVSNAGIKGTATGVAPGSSTIGALFAGQAGSTTLQVTNATLTALAVSPNSASIALGASQNLAAKGTFSDGSVLDLSTQVVWTSSNANVAVINTQGLASSVSSGTTTVAASLNGVSGTAVLTVQ